MMKWLLLIALAFCGYGYFHREWDKQWQTQYDVTVGIETVMVWQKAPNDPNNYRGYITVNKPMLLVTLWTTRPSSEKTWYGLPREHSTGWAHVRGYANPPTDPVELHKMIRSAWEWVESSEGQQKIKKIKDESRRIHNEANHRSSAAPMQLVCLH